MILDARKFVVLPVLILLFTPLVKAAGTTKKLPPRADSISVWQARRALAAGTEYLAWHRGKIDRSSFRFTPDSIEFDAFKSTGGAEHFKVDLQTLEPVAVKCNSYGRQVVACFLKDEAGKSCPPPLDLIWREGSIWSAKCSDDCVYAAESFAAALNRLRVFAKDTSSPLHTFTQRAAAWRALAAKPPIPEQVREQRLLAEDAFKEKKLEESLDHYESGLELDPTWEQGYFNAALIAAELGFYPEAVEQMQAYLELVPDAPDSQSARDQIVIWQYKAKQGVATDAGNPLKK
jgi:tetratricopeptide (TPR) repeat protein